MKKYSVLVFILVLALVTGIAAWLHLSTREEVALGTLQITAHGQVKTVNLSELDYEQVSGVRVNGKGESIPVEGEGISVKALLETLKVGSCNKVTVISDDAYTAQIMAEEIAEEGKAWLLLDDVYLRLVVFGDSNSKRSVSNVVQIIVE